TVVLSLEDLGFCAKGEGGAFVEGGRLRFDGELPTNTDGGGLSACHPGMRGMFLIVEAVRQLRGESVNQADDPEVALARGTGGGTVYSFTAIRQISSRSSRHLIPYVVALVDLDDGPRLMSNLVDSDHDDVRIGMRVRARFEPVSEDASIPLFEPA